MNRIFIRFVDHLLGSPDLSVLHSALGDTAGALGLHTFAYLSPPQGPKGKISLISNYPASWTMRYLSNRYEKLDPVIIQALQDPEPFEWGPELRTTGLLEVQRQFFDEAAQFGIRSGYTIPIHVQKDLVLRPYQG